MLKVIYQKTTLGLEFWLENHKTGIPVALACYKKIVGAKIVIFQPDFFGGFIPKVLTTSVITFDTCLAKFVIETGVWSSCEGDRGNCMQIHGK